MSLEYSDWEKLYQEKPSKDLPWYFKGLDPDLHQEIIQKGIKSGTFLDIGAGPGTQAAALSKLGFRVTATDISETAVKKAQSLFLEVNFIQDNFIETKLTQKFDYIFDRGLFHTIHKEDRMFYLMNVTKLLNKDSFLFLKCFSIKETEHLEGPHRFSHEDIHTLFGTDFWIEPIKDSVFLGTKTHLSKEEYEHHPKALFVVMKKK